MVLEVSELTQASVVSVEEKKLATIDKIIFDGNEVKIAGFQVKLAGLVPKFVGLDFSDVLSCARQEVVVDSGQKFDSNLKTLDDLRAQFGSVLKTKAKTESGDQLGHVEDVVVDVDTGLVVRFYLKTLLKERIIPRQYLVAITPKVVIFQDVVNQPLFDESLVVPSTAA